MLKGYLYIFVGSFVVAVLSVLGHNWAYAMWGESAWPAVAFFYLFFISLAAAIISFIVYLIKVIIKK